jgi:hypothetical protein
MLVCEEKKSFWERKQLKEGTEERKHGTLGKP